MKVKIYYAEVAPELEAPEFDLNSLKVRGDCTIGRSPECGLVLDGADLSRQHAKFSTKNGSYYFTDLGSRNGSLFNGALVDGGREYPMNAGDTIRIGDFILKVEEEPELAATVFKVIDPALFKVSQPQVENPVNLAAAAIAPLIVSGIIINDPSEIALPDVRSEQPPSIELVEDNIDIATPLVVVAQTHPASAIGDELSVVTPLDLGAEQPPSLDSLDRNLDSTDPLDSILAQTPPTAVIIDDWGVENSLDLTLEPWPPLASIDEDSDDFESLDRALADHSDLSIDLEEPEVQPPSSLLVNEKLAEPETAPSSAVVESDDSADLADLDLLAQPEIALEIDRTDDENALYRSQEYPLPPLTNDVWNDEEDTPALPVKPAIVGVNNDDLSLVDLTDRSPLALDSDASNEEPISPKSAVAPAPTLASELASAPVTPELDLPLQLPVLLVIDELVVAETPNLGLENPELIIKELEVETPDLGLVSLDLTTDELEDIDTFEQSQTATVASEASSELELEISPTVNTTAPIAAAATAAVISGFNAYNHGNGAELLSKKQIVLIAHDSKIADLTDIVERHKDFLAKCLTISWLSIVVDVRQQTGLEIQQQIPSGASGGYQTIASLVNAGDVLAVIFLKDFFAPPQAGQANEEALLRLCNINEILLATNIATADSIVHYLQS